MYFEIAVVTVAPWSGTDGHLCAAVEVTSFSVGEVMAHRQRMGNRDGTTNFTLYRPRLTARPWFQPSVCFQQMHRKGPTPIGLAATRGFIPRHGWSRDRRTRHSRSLGHWSLRYEVHTCPTHARGGMRASCATKCVGGHLRRQSCSTFSGARSSGRGGGKNVTASGASGGRRRWLLIHGLARRLLRPDAASVRQCGGWWEPTQPTYKSCT